MKYPNKQFLGTIGFGPTSKDRLPESIWVRFSHAMTVKYELFLYPLAEQFVGLWGWLQLNIAQHT